MAKGLIDDIIAAEEAEMQSQSQVKHLVLQDVMRPKKVSDNG